MGPWICERKHSLVWTGLVRCSKMRRESLYGAVQNTTTKKKKKNTGRRREEAQSSAPLGPSVVEWREGGQIKEVLGIRSLLAPRCHLLKAEFDNALEDIRFRMFPEVGMSMALKFHWALQFLDWPYIPGVHHISQPSLNAARDLFKHIRALPAETNHGLALQMGKPTAFSKASRGMSSHILTKTVDSVLDGTLWGHDKWV